MDITDLTLPFTGSDPLWLPSKFHRKYVVCKNGGVLRSGSGSAADGDTIAISQQFRDLPGLYFPAQHKADAQTEKSCGFRPLLNIFFRVTLKIIEDVQLRLAA